MSLLSAWALVPLVLLALCLGTGLLVDLVAGRRLPGPLLLPAGLTVVAVAALLAALDETAADLAVPVAFALAVLGAGLSFPWRLGRPDPRQLGVALAAFLLVAVPALLAGESGAGLEPGLAWAFQPCLAFLAAILALCLWQLLAALLARRPRCAAGVFALATLAAAALYPGLAVYAGGLAGYERLVELELVGESFAGQGPALLAEESAFGAEHALGELDVEVVDAVDLDAAGLQLERLFEHRTLVLRRGPRSSRPPLPYRLVARGERYAVWQRPLEPEGPVLHHMPLGRPGSVAGPPDCSEVVGLGLLALSNQLGYPPQSTRIVAAAPGGGTVSVRVEQARDLCGRRWDWIEAVGTPSPPSG